MTFRRGVTGAIFAVASALLVIEHGVALGDESGGTSSSREFHSQSFITHVMHYLQSRTVLQLVLPTYIPMQPATDPYAFYYVGARIFITKTSYQVALNYVDEPLPINSVRLNSLQYTGLGRILGGFGATRYPTKAEAVASCTQRLRKMSGRISKAALGHGIVAETVEATSSKKLGGPAVLEWHERGWTFQVVNASTIYDVQLAKGLVSSVAEHPIQKRRGFVVVENAGDGEHTEAMWTSGAIVYNCSNYHDARQAIKMVESMHAY